jgi:hypothetical protein
MTVVLIEKSVFNGVFSHHEIEVFTKLHQETVHLLIRLTVYNYDKIISVYKLLK